MGFGFLILPTLIFLSRICDVTLGTIRIIFVAKGKKYLAPVLGFFEVLIWLIAMQQIMSNVTNIWLYITYAAGFAAGNFVGIMIEDKLSIGKIMIRIITQNGADDLIDVLKDKEYRLTYVNAHGRDNKVKIIFSIIDRKKIKDITSIIHNINPKAFYSIEDIRFAREVDQNNPLFFNSFGYYTKCR